MADSQKILATIRKATTLFRATPGRKGSVVYLDAAEDVLVAGDLHGHVHTFAQLLKIAGLDRFPKRHLVLQELVHDPRIDPVDGIDRSHRLIDLVCALKCQFPDRVHVLLGNHELSEFTGRSIAKHGADLNALFRKGVQSSYGAAVDQLIPAYHELFRSYPVFCRLPNRVLLCHTVPNGDDLDALDLKILETGVWPPESLQRGGTIYALTWGRDTTPETADRFAKLVDADWFICGHQPCNDGFMHANHRQLIIDATDPIPIYCHIPSRDAINMEGLLATVRRVPIAAAV